MTVKIVTDSTCDLPVEVVEQLGITVIPMYINIGERGYLDGVDISREAFYTNLPDYKVHPTTGVPGINAFSKAYARLAESGASQILSIHVSKSLSAVVNVASTAGQASEHVPVTVHDSGQLSLGTGFQVETAARMALAGEPMDEILRALNDLARRTFVAAGLDTLEFLRRSGRMNAVMTGLGSLLQVKPILTMRDGVPGSERVRTSAAAENRLVELLEACQPLERFGLLHTHAPQKADRFWSRIEHEIREMEVYNMDITPVIGIHIGPGAVGYAVVTQS